MLSFEAPELLTCATMLKLCRAPAGFWYSRTCIQNAVLHGYRRLLRSPHSPAIALARAHTCPSSVPKAVCREAKQLKHLKASLIRLIPLSSRSLIVELSRSGVGCCEKVKLAHGSKPQLNKCTGESEANRKSSSKALDIFVSADLCMYAWGTCF